MSRRGKSKACAATFVERKTRMYIALTMPDRIAHSKEVAFVVLASQYPASAVLTATADRGKEFACYAPVWNISTACRYISRSVFVLRARHQRKQQRPS
ncbi:hypothetical protein M5W70_12415 [Paenibacillus larvae]|uniref:Transposase n=1 Tax=Paenibacillus larvae TaxID=1464 RepID=A0AAP5JY61_9BACL|nr:hypothetical protein [Paenibacillus larvae]MCY9689482.1 hypothetical protein [Paenibacillus larvae]MDT2253961.1 hypothetical protein [Paenibacillus larvae]